jgi:hypothetical protein
LSNPSELPGEIEHLNRLGVTGHISHGISLHSLPGRSAVPD